MSSATGDDRRDSVPTGSDPGAAPPTRAGGRDAAAGRRPLARLLVIALTLLVPLLLAEIVVRWLYDLPTPESRRSKSLRYQPAVFARHLFPTEVQRLERYRVNRLGYRGPDFSETKPAGAVRVVILGGSQVFDPFCNDQQQWPYRLAVELRKLGALDVRVINAGVPGHASIDSLGRLLTEVHRLRPDWLILDNAWNDFKLFSSRRSLARALQPYRPDRDLRIAYANGVDRLAVRVSHLYRLLREAYLRRRLRVGLEGRTREGTLAARLEPSALEQYRLTVSTFVDVARTLGARPILMLQPRLALPGLAPALRAKIRLRYVGLTQEALLAAYVATDRVLRTIAREKRVSLFAAGIDGRGELFVDHVHLTPRGSAELARKLALFLATRLAAARQPKPPTPQPKPPTPQPKPPTPQPKPPTPQPKPPTPQPKPPTPQPKPPTPQPE